MADLIHIDGSFGEGGGQILRSALALSALAGRGFRISNIRANRDKPGLRRQHLTAVRAAAEVCGAEVSGDAIGSSELTFTPGTVRPGEYTFDIGTAGSTTLVLQTALPPLLTAPEPTILTLVGGTHNPNCPPFDFLAKAFLPLLRKMGATVEAELERPGFYPAGGGRITVAIQPGNLRPIEIGPRGEVHAVRGRAIVSHLPRTIGTREVAVIGKELDLRPDALTVDEANAAGPGNVVMVEVESPEVTEVFTAFGERGVPAERVAMQAIEGAKRYLASQVAVGDCLADQLLLPMALAGGGEFHTLAPTRHTQTNVEVIRMFLDIRCRLDEVSQDHWVVEIGKA